MTRYSIALVLLLVALQIVIGVTGLAVSADNKDFKGKPGYILRACNVEYVGTSAGEPIEASYADDSDYIAFESKNYTLYVERTTWVKYLSSTIVDKETK